MVIKLLNNRTKVIYGLTSLIFISREEVHSVTDIGTTSRVQILEKAVCISLRADHLGKSINVSLHLQAMGKWLVSFRHDTATDE